MADTFLRNDNLKGITERIVEAILEEPILEKQRLTIKVRSLLNIWFKINTRPQSYDKVKTDKGRLKLCSRY